MTVSIGIFIYLLERVGLGFLNENPEVLASAWKALNAEVLPRHLQYMENFAKVSTTGWIANTEAPTIADFYVAPRLRWLVSGRTHASRDLLVACPHLTAYVDKFHSLPQVVEYYAQREAAVKH